MKYLNKKKPRKNWIKVAVPIASRAKTSDAKVWCQQQPGNGRFYCSFWLDWEFERSEDALAFKLKYG